MSFHAASELPAWAWETEARIQTVVLKGGVRYHGELCSAALPKDGPLIALLSLPFSVPGLRHLSVAGGKGQSTDPNLQNAKIRKLGFKRKDCIIFLNQIFHPDGGVLPRGAGSCEEAA